VYSISEIFGISSDDMARSDAHDPTTPYRTYSTAENSPGALNPPDNPLAALLDPKGSPIFWIALFSILGLVLVTGQIRVEGALGSRVGKGKR
jgi:hypothetical protein